MIRAFFIAKLLGPHGFGIWRFINLFLEYLHLVSLGTQPAMQRTIPFLRGKGDSERIDVVLKTACATTFLCSILYTLGVFISSFFLSDTATAAALAAFCPVILVLAWLRYAQEFSLAAALYSLRRRLETVDMILSMFFSVILTYLWGVYGAIAGMGISALIAVFISIPHLWRFTTAAIEWRILRELVVTGIPILADILLLITMANSDRIVIAALLNHEMLGIYSVGAAGFAILGTIPAALGQMLFIKFAEMDGLNKSKDHIADTLERSTLLLASVLAPVVCIALAAFPIAVTFLLPAYVGGIDAGKLLIATVFFLGISLPASKWCISTGRFVPVLAVRFSVVITELVLLYFVVGSGASLMSIALCVLLSFVIFSSVIIALTSRVLERSSRIGLMNAAKSTLPFVSVLLALWTQHIYSKDIDQAGLGLMISNFVGLTVGVTASVPFLIWANRRTHIIDILFSPSGRFAFAKSPPQ